ncbi:MAG TPA: tyrosine-type recombinase/integrase, partial [Acidobacteriota bacterium]|nr:tyrosine-type recombinase/integrase [Acidobacteriota bacterium]
YPNRKQAENMLTRIEASILDGSWKEFRERLQLRNLNKITLREFSETYMQEYCRPRNKRKTCRRKQTSLNSLNAFMGSTDMPSISPALLHNYVQRRKAKGLSDASVNHDIVTLKHLLGHAVEKGLLSSNPISNFKRLRGEQKERPRFSDQQIDNVISAVRADCRALFVFIRETGCRREEALSLTWAQVHADSRMLVFAQDTKSRKYRYVPLTDAALEAIHTLPRLRECPYVFYNPKTKDRWEHCRRPWETARRKAGVPNLMVKDLRRHFAIKLAEQGTDMKDIQQVLGHASVATTEKHYAHFSPTHSARKVLRMLQGGKSGELTRNSPSKHRSDSEVTGL